MTQDGGPRVGLCLSTFQRPDMLRALLLGIGTQEFTLNPAPNIDIFVVDNDADATARATCEGLENFHWRLHYSVESKRGIPQTRNHAVKQALAAGCELLVFIDDDESPDSQWLDQLLYCRRYFRADIVAGPAICVFEDGSNQKLIQEGHFDRLRQATGERIYWAATNNLLVSRQVFERIGGFEESWALSGGTDALLTTKASKAGFLLVWCDEAIVYDSIPNNRVQTSWLLQRWFRLGVDKGKLEITLSSSKGERWREFKLGLRQIQGAFSRLAFSKNWNGMNAARYMLIGLGRIWASLGLRYDEYQFFH